MTERLDATAVAALLVELGQRVELSGDSAFKARAYHRAAESLRALALPLDEVVGQGRLREIPGIGAAVEEKIEALHRTGTHRTLERLRAELPASVLEMLSIPGLAAPKVRQIFDLGISDIEQLEAACRDGKLAPVKGLGPALQKKILQGIDILRRSSGQRHIHHAGALLAFSAETLAQWRPELARIVMAGDYRRGCELVHDLHLVAQAPGELTTVATERIGGDVDLTVADEPRYGVALLFATGSAEHLTQLQSRAAAMGLTLDKQGLRRGRDFIPCATEAELYAALALPFIEPELREGADEIALAEAGQLPALVGEADLRGILHSHTDQSDGTFSLEDMAEATRQRGYNYFGVADHSQSAGYAGGLSLAEIEAQHVEADRLNKRYKGKFRILKGIESDILLDGSLDYPEEILARFDFVVASIHSRFALDPAAQTERMLKAVANPFTTILGHMTGRLLLRREGYEIDIDRVLQACAAHGVVVEINANPHRLDLDWRWHRRALELGCILSINPDAHSIAELDLTRWGVAMARKGGVSKERVLNCMDLPEITAFLDARRQARSGGAGPPVSAGRRGRGRAPGRSGPAPAS